MQEKRPFFLSHARGGHVTRKQQNKGARGMWRGLTTGGRHKKAKQQNLGARGMWRGFTTGGRGKKKHPAAQSPVPGGPTSSEALR